MPSNLLAPSWYRFLHWLSRLHWDSLRKIKKLRMTNGGLFLVLFTHILGTMGVRNERNEKNRVKRSGTRDWNDCSEVIPSCYSRSYPYEPRLPLRPGQIIPLTLHSQPGVHMVASLFRSSVSISFHYVAVIFTSFAPSLRFATFDETPYVIISIWVTQKIYYNSYFSYLPVIYRVVG